MPLAQQGSRQHTSSGTGSTTTGTTSSHENPNSITELRSKSRRTNNAPGWGGDWSTLFWAHTDPQSALEGIREETLKRICSHVMSEHNYHKKRQDTKRHSTKTWKHLAFQPVETTAMAAASNNNNTTTTITATTSASTFSKAKIASVD